MIRLYRVRKAKTTVCGLMPLANPILRQNPILNSQHFTLSVKASTLKTGSTETLPALQIAKYEFRCWPCCRHFPQTAVWGSTTVLSLLQPEVLGLLPLEYGK